MTKFSGPGLECVMSTSMGGPSTSNGLGGAVCPVTGSPLMYGLSSCLGGGCRLVFGVFAGGRRVILSRGSGLDGEGVTTVWGCGIGVGLTWVCLLVGRASFCFSGFL